MRISGKKLVTSIGTVSLAASSLLFAATPPASASCTTQPSVNIIESHYQGYAFVGGNLIADPCGLGMEVGIEGPDGTPSSWGNDTKVVGTASATGFIPANSGNHHGMRYWVGKEWVHVWLD